MTGETKRDEDRSNGQRVILTRWGRVKIGFGFVVGGAIGAYSLYIAWLQPSQFSLPIWFLGGIAGWIGGIFLSPTTKAEGGLFSAYTSAIATFVSGFALAKLDRLWERAVPETAPISSEMLMNVVLFLIAFGLGFLFPFIGRTSEYQLIDAQPTDTAARGAKTEARP